MSLHVAFLRGVGAARPATGEALRACLGAAGYEPVRPVLATGNVIFGLGRKRKPPDEPTLSALIEAHFGYPLPAFLRTAGDVEAMVGGDPFRGTDKATLTRFVALLAADAGPADAFPDPERGAGYRLIERRERELFFDDRPRRDQDPGGDGEDRARLSQARHHAQLEHDGEGRGDPRGRHGRVANAVRLGSPA